MDPFKQSLIQAHRAHWGTTGIWIAFTLVLFAANGLLLWSATAGHFWLAVLLTLIVAHLMHSQLLAFHEAAHGILCPNRLVNEIIGVVIGNFLFLGLSLFRAIHHTHHAYLGTRNDDELWPFVQPGTPRWLRRLAAAFELCLGLVWDMILFWRAFLRKDSLVQNRRVRRRVWMELGLMVVMWSLILAATALAGAWVWLAVGFLIPALLAGNMHSLRKFIEHMGMTGSTVLGLTRSVVPDTWAGRFLSFTMFHITYHGVHHRYARMPQAALPRFTVMLQGKTPDEQTTFPSYWSAFCAMLPSLADPRIGFQWLETEKEKLLPVPPVRKAG